MTCKIFFNIQYNIWKNIFLTSPTDMFRGTLYMLVDLHYIGIFFKYAFLFKKLWLQHIHTLTRKSHFIIIQLNTEY